MAEPTTAESVAREIADDPRSHPDRSGGRAHLMFAIAAALQSRDAACAQRVREAYEKAAKIAETLRPAKNSSTHDTKPWEIAAAIRSLINTEASK